MPSRCDRRRAFPAAPSVRHARFAIARRLVLAIIAVGSLPVLAAERPSFESTVIFNTACARCHEGECSGRMSFQLPKTAADQHIRRHGGHLSPGQIEQLFELLRFMKEKCAFYPLDIALVTDRVWAGEALARLRSPAQTAFFIPLGRLAPGAYRVSLEGLEAGTGVCAEVISDEFEFIHQAPLRDEGETRGLGIRVDEPAEYFLRLSAPKALTLRRVELLSGDRPEVPAAAGQTR